MKAMNDVFRCSPRYQGKEPWFDWCLIKFDKEEGDRDGLYPARILGIFQYETEGIADLGYKVCVRTSREALDMKKFKSDFVTKFTVDHTYQEHEEVIDAALTIVPAKNVSGPLFVFENNGGPITGECHHKRFVKDMGYNSQGRVNNFSSQVAQKYYESLLFAIAKAGAKRREQKKFKRIGTSMNPKTGFSVEGKYHLRIHAMNKGVSTNHSTSWAQAATRRSSCDVHNHSHSRGWSDGFNVL